jgi:circadian clock protein KaiC
MTGSSLLSPERIPTGVPGLDTVLRGGFRKGRTYMLMGLPGAGKTILANQVCFHHASNGGRVLYITLLAESHTDLVGNLSSLRFFNSSRIPETITYLSAYSVLEHGGLDALTELLRKETRAQQASLLVLDGLVAAEEVAPSAQALKKFIHGLQVVSQLVGCTTLVLTTGGGQGLRAEHTMVDGLLVLKQRLFGVRAIRELVVRKFRGSDYLMGPHGFEITGEGLTVYPRLETLLLLEEPGPRRGPSRTARHAFGIPGLDKMLHGGLPAGGSTSLLGAPGAGKTLLGMNFLVEGARRGERGHYFAFYDSPERMVAQLAGIGVDLEPLIESGALEVSYRPATENLLDKLGMQLLAAIRERGVKRLFLDGFEGLQKASVRKLRAVRFLAALVNACRVHGVSLVYSMETSSAFGPEVLFPMKGLSMVAENILFLRTTELHSELRRFICALKVRNSDFDPALRELRISRKGLEVGQTFEDAQQLITGLARTHSKKASRPRRILKRRGK